jgi:hypothetical protein
MPGSRAGVIIIIIITSWFAWLLLQAGISVESVVVLLVAITTSVTATARFIHKPGASGGGR